MRKLWLIFAQTVTVGLGLFFVVGALRPDLLPLPRPLKPNSANQTGQSVPRVVEGGDSFRDAATQALPAVVHIFTSQSSRKKGRNAKSERKPFDFFDDRSPNGEAYAGLGSGVIVSADGYVLTNDHVVEGADLIEVKLNDGSVLLAHLVGGDEESDLAVLKLDGVSKPLTPITLGNMADVSVGDIALAIGNPFGVGQTMTMGIVSALGRSHLGLNTFENFIQTDAAINPGNSGGALVDRRGRLIGINTAIYSRSGGSLGIGFAIPISTAKNVLEQIVATGTVTRGWIGVEAQEITQELAESFGLAEASGALIAGVQRGGPADIGGVKPGDVLLEVAGKSVKDPQAMLDVIAAQKPGEKVAIKLKREKEENGRLFETTVEIGKRPKISNR